MLISVARAVLLVNFMWDVGDLVSTMVPGDAPVPTWPSFAFHAGGGLEWAQRGLWLSLFVLFAGPLRELGYTHVHDLRRDHWAPQWHELLRLLMFASAVVLVATILVTTFSTTSRVTSMLFSVRASVMGVASLLLAFRLRPSSLPAVEPFVPVLPPTPTTSPRLVATPAVVVPRALHRCAACDAAIDSWTCRRCGAASSLERWQMMQVLATRSQGRTYLATDNEGPLVVIKELVLSRANDVAVVDAFEREAALLSSLRHARMPRLLMHLRRTDESGAMRLFTVMTYLPGVQLDRFVAERGLTGAEVETLLREGLELILFLQMRTPPVLHRDIKPSNLMILKDGSLALVDFGVARQLDGRALEGTLVGTVGYMPREQLAGRVDGRSDLYALAMSLICLFIGTEPAQLMNEFGGITLPALALEPRVARVLRRLVANVPDARFPDARAALIALDARRWSTSRWVALGAAAVVLLSVVGVGAKKVARLDSPAPQVPMSPGAGVAPVSAPTGSPVIARFEGGVVTEAEVEEELGRLPPVIVGTYAAYRTDLVRSLAVQKTLDERARRRGIAAATRFERLRALFPEVDQRARREAFEAAVATVPIPLIVDPARLAALRPRVPDGASPPIMAGFHEFPVYLDAFTQLRGVRESDGSFELEWPGADVRQPGATTFLRPIDWVYIDLVVPELTAGNYVLHTPALVYSGGALSAWGAMPPGTPDRYAFMRRYQVVIKPERLVNMRVGEAEVVLGRIDGALARCLRLAAWDLRWEHVDVFFDVTVEGGVMSSSDPRFEIHRVVPTERSGALVMLDHASWCGFALTRYRWPDKKTGSLTVRATIEGRAWTDEEQDFSLRPE